MFFCFSACVLQSILYKGNGFVSRQGFFCPFSICHICLASREATKSTWHQRSDRCAPIPMPEGQMEAPRRITMLLLHFRDTFPEQNPRMTPNTWMNLRNVTVLLGSNLSVEFSDPPLGECHFFFPGYQGKKQLFPLSLVGTM